MIGTVYAVDFLSINCFMGNNMKFDLERYAPHYSVDRLFNKLKKYGKKAGKKVAYLALLLYYVLISEDLSKDDKLKICGALGYLILPADLLPDPILFVGFTDDLAALLWCYKKISSHVTEEMKE